MEELTTLLTRLPTFSLVSSWPRTCKERCQNPDTHGFMVVFSHPFRPQHIPKIPRYSRSHIPWAPTTLFINFSRFATSVNLYKLFAKTWSAFQLRGKKTALKGCIHGLTFKGISGVGDGSLVASKITKGDRTLFYISWWKWSIFQVLFISDLVDKTRTGTSTFWARTELGREKSKTTR